MSRARETLVQRDSSLPRRDLCTEADVEAYARALAAKQRRDRARAWLEASVKRGWHGSVHQCANDPECLLRDGHAGLCDVDAYL